MTDKIDLDDRAEEEADESGDEETLSEADRLWRDVDVRDAPPRSADGSARGDAATDRTGDAPSEPAGDAPSGGIGSDEASEARGDEASGTESTTDARVPHVPRRHKDRPVGVPEASGGGGGASAFGESESATDAPAAETHAGGADDVTLALTYGAAQRLEDPTVVLTGAQEWADWIGLVGDVSAPVIQKFQRDHGIDADFFNGGGTGPADRLSEIGPRSMFYADRMVVVGVAGEDEQVAERAGWEFVPLSEAAAKAEWALSA